MKVLAVVFAVLAVAQCGLIPATTLVRAPAHDSAIIKSERLGGNFAYSTVEGHAYAAVSPIISQVAVPAAVSYHAQPYAIPASIPAAIHTSIPAAIPVAAHGLVHALH